MILNDYSEFMRFIPTTFDAGNDVSLFAEWVDMAELMATDDLLGEDLALYVSALEENDSLRLLCKRYICHRALYEAIPNLDLVLTGNGFGVVGGTGSKYVPASKDRVAALRYQEDIWQEKLRESIIRRLSVVPEYLSEWRKSPVWPVIAGHLFVGYTDYRTYTPAEDMRNVEVYRKSMARAESLLAEYIHPFISPEYYRELLEKQYTSILATPDYSVLHSVKSTIGALIRSEIPTQSDINTAYRNMDAAVNLMCAQLEQYPVYATSKEYALKTAVQYENKQEHATYFGGI